MFYYEDVFRVFNRHKVKYIIVGGIAMNLLGSLRNTADLDILVEMSDKNLLKMVNLLKEKKYKVRQPVDPMNLAIKQIRESWIKEKNMKAFNFYKDDDLSEIDIIIDSPVSFEEARKSMVYVNVGNLKLPVISLDNLMKMKSKAFRTIDRLDLTELKKIKRLRRKNDS